MTLKAALPSIMSLPASCHVSDAASEFVYFVSRSLKRLIAVVTSALDQLPPFVHRFAQPDGPSVEIRIVSNRCFCVHCSPSESGVMLESYALTLSRAAMKPSHD